MALNKLPTPVRRNPAETLAASLATSGKKLGAMDFNALTKGDLDLVIKAMTDMRDILETASSKVLKSWEKSA